MITKAQALQCIEEVDDTLVVLMQYARENNNNTAMDALLEIDYWFLQAIDAIEDFGGVQ